MTDALPVAGPNPGKAAQWAHDRDTPGTMEMIVQRMAEGETPQEICKSCGWPYSLFAQWVIEDLGRAELFARASRFWVDALARGTVKRAADAPETKVGIAKAKLEIDTNLRVAGKLFREQYGEAAAVNVKVDGALALPDRETLVLETARAVGYFLEAGVRVAEQRELQKPIESVEAETVQPLPIEKQSDAGLI